MKIMNVTKDEIRDLIFNESKEYIQEKIKRLYDIHEKIDEWYANNMPETALECKSREE